MNLAQFPWDPKPEAQPAPAPASGPPAAAPPSSLPATTAGYTQSTLSPQGSAQTLSLPGNLMPNNNPMAMKPEPGYAQAEPAIKQEPGLQPAHPGYNPANGARPTTAAQRAAFALESQYGQRAAASISAIHSGMAQVNPAGQPQQGPRPGQQVPQHMNQYRQGVSSAMQQRMQQVQQAPRPGQPNGLPPSQLDGPGDEAEEASPVLMDRAQIDEHLHAQIAARAKQMEGGGLMLPLKQATKDRSLAGKRSTADGPAQLDGGLDDDVKSEEDDEDAINSDLDDPDEAGDDDEDDDDSMGHMMLCMYDKVQRVKNKWKCVLKDGVLTVNGKEYVFTKATGEYEW
jgi:transcription initiation factor TFIIA large subunit